MRWTRKPHEPWETVPDPQEMWLAVNEAITYLFVDDLLVHERGALTRRELEDLAANVADEISARFEIRWRPGARARSGPP